MYILIEIMTSNNKWLSQSGTLCPGFHFERGPRRNGPPAGKQEDRQRNPQHLRV